MPILPGYVVTLKCLGTVPGPTYLDGRTANGSVGLAPNTTNPPYSGTRWSVENGGSAGIVILKCLGTVPGPTYLDGRTANATVGLAPNTNNPPYSGTRWRVEDGGQGAVILQCQGTIPGPTFLNGLTGNGTVDLAPSTGGVYTGTRWDAEPFLTLDQSQTSSDAAGGAADDWQSFTAGLTGLMSRLDVMVASGLGPQPQTGTIRIYQGEGTGGSLLATQSFNFQPVYTTFQECGFPSPFQVVAGQKYTYRLTIPTERVGWIYTAPASAYPRGRCSLPNTAMVFRTWLMAA